MPRRLLAAAIAVALAVAVLGWLLLGLIGFGLFFHTAEDGGCQQPEYLYGAAWIVEALLGIAVACVGIRGGIRVATARTARWTDAWCLLVTGALAGAWVVTVTVFNPNFTVIPGPC